MPDQKIPAHDPTHKFAEETKVEEGIAICLFCNKVQTGAFLVYVAHYMSKKRNTYACRACIRLALWRMAEIPEGQS